MGERAGSARREVWIAASRLGLRLRTQNRVYERRIASS